MVLTPNHVSFFWGHVDSASWDQFAQIIHFRNAGCSALTESRLGFF